MVIRTRVALGLVAAAGSALMIGSAAPALASAAPARTVHPAGISWFYITEPGSGATAALAEQNAAARVEASEPKQAYCSGPNLVGSPYYTASTGLWTAVEQAACTYDIE